MQSGSNFAELSKDFIEPFREVYLLVTAEINGHRVFNEPPGSFPREWLRTITDRFWNEFNDWEHRADYTEYFQVCKQRGLRFRFLNLVVCAYLHISYDLPRVLANEWPDLPPGTDHDKEARARLLYYDLTPIFPHLGEVVKGEKRILGIYRHVYRLLPKSVYSEAVFAASTWALHLRTASWDYGRELALQSTDVRKATEARMIRAMAMALEDVSNNPLTTGRLLPPHERYNGFLALPIAALSSAEQFAIWVSLGGALLSASIVILYSWWRERRRVKEERSETIVLRMERLQETVRQIGEQHRGAHLLPSAQNDLWIAFVQFINEFGALTADYMHKAVMDPEAFERLIFERRRRRR